VSFNKIDYTLYLVTDRNILAGRDLLKSIEEAIDGGATLVQLREKDVSTLEFLNIALKVKAITDKHNIPLIINDRLDIALAADAAGLHIGQEDLPLKIARKLLGYTKIIGVSTSNVNEAIEAENGGADYVGVGAMFPTDTKKDADSVTLEELHRIKNSISIPVVAIGGINKSNIKSVINAGADGAAVISAVLGEKDIKSACLSLLE
jgi:thiamine-phosphate pyrophosphorylase